MPGTGFVSTVDGSRLYFEECGQGSAVVLIHDGVTGAAGWDLIWPALCAKHRVIRYDRRGVGRSGAPSASYSSTADLARLLADRHVSTATFVGASSGGALAIDFAILAPASVDRLVLIGAVVNGLGYSDHFLQRERANLAPLAQGDAAGAAANQVNDRHALAPANDSARRRLEDILRRSPHNLRKHGDLELPSPSPVMTHLSDIRVPTLILVGEHDIADVHAHAGAIELGIWGARREIMRDAGHLIQLDQPEVLSDRIVAFIAESPVVALRADRLRALAGPYTSPVTPGQTGRFYVQGGRLFAQFSGGRDVPLYPSSDSTFYTLARTRSQVTFRRDSRNRVVAADILVGGRLLTAVRLSRSP